MQRGGRHPSSSCFLFSLLAPLLSPHTKSWERLRQSHADQENEEEERGERREARKEKRRSPSHPELRFTMYAPCMSALLDVSRSWVYTIFTPLVKKREEEKEKRGEERGRRKRRRWKMLSTTKTTTGTSRQGERNGEGEGEEEREERRRGNKRKRKIQNKTGMRRDALETATPK